MLVRKTVTVLFCDVVTSTDLGERLDPESFRRIMSRYFDEMRAVLERHGGTVEKFIGDEVMAVFGVPTIHEDDALRAVRAAAEMRERLAELNDELEATWGVRLEARTGVNTGEVVAGDPAAGGTFVTGEPVVLAKRLEQAARPGEILIGKATHPLVKDAIRAGPLESFPVKGKSQPVAPFRLEHVEAGAAGLARRLDTPLVDRLGELASLREAFEAAVAERRCRLVTMLGPAGIGKSRLVGELLASLGASAAALTGRCLAYGDGITFWPLAEIVRQLDLEAALAGADDADAIAKLVRGTVGAEGQAGAGEETFWAVRRLFEAVARRRPLVVCLEDIHWAEPTFLDLIEYLAGWTRDAAILLVCLARPDLLDLRPTWSSPAPNASILALEPLSAGESDELLEALRGETDLSQSTRARIAHAAEGNPLFVEQMIAMVTSDGGNGELAVPPSIQALLAERLDRLSAEERAVIERAAVAGKEFPRGAVVVLSPAAIRADVGRHLMALVRKELIQPDTSQFAREDGFRFRHALIRDAAYDGLPKEVRAELHEQFAAWLEAHAGERATELEEIMGYHLEQAFQYREQLGRVEDSTRALGARGAAKLTSAGRRALARGDTPAAVGLLTRATVLLRDDDAARLELAPDLGFALIERGDLEQADGLLSRAVETAARVGDRDAHAHALVARGHLIAKADPTGAFDEVEDLADQAIATFSEIDDPRGLAQAWRLVALAESWRCRYGAMAHALERALAYADRAGHERERAVILHWLGVTRYYGPTPVEVAVRWCEETLKRTSDRTVQAMEIALTGGLLAMQARFDEARERAAQSKALLEELGAVVKAGHARSFAGEAEMLAGDASAAEHEFREGYETLTKAGDHNGALNTIFELAEALYAQDRYSEAEDCVAVGLEDRDRSDSMTRVVGMGIEAKLLARRGRLEDGETVARRAVALGEETDAPNIQAGAWLSLAEVLRLAGDGAAATCVAAAVRLFEAKGNIAAAARARGVLEGAAADV